MDPDIGSSALVLPDEALSEGGMLAMSGPAAVEAGAVTREELDALVSAGPRRRPAVRRSCR